MTSRVARGGAVVVGLLMLAIGWFGGLHASGNYHEVIPGEYYRAGQLNAAALSDRIARNGIRSVVNLRGQQTGKGWYDAEIAVTQAAGVRHYDVPLQSSRSVTEDQAQRLLEVLRSAPKPVLVHCEGGADRTGLATALYLADTGHAMDEAAGALSVRYGFVGIKGVTRPWPMWESWRRLGPSVAAAAAGHSSASISAP